MSWFRKEPPPPKRTNWVGIAVPIVFAAFVALIGMVWNSSAEDIKEVKKEMEQKVDNKTLQMQIEVLKEKDETSEEYRKKNDARLEVLILEMQEIKMKQQTAPVVIPQQTTITKEQYDFYMKLTPEQKIEFKKLNPEFQGLP